MRRRRKNGEGRADGRVVTPDSLFNKPSADDTWAQARARLAAYCPMTARAAAGEPPRTYVGKELEAIGGF